MNWFKSFWKALNTPQPHGTATTMPREEIYFIENNFTPRAQQVLALARREADRFNHNFVGTEHLLLGLVALGQGTAVTALRRMGVDLNTVRAEVEKQVGTGPDQKMLGNIPYTPRVKKVLALAGKEAKALQHTYVGTEHILLGLLSEGDGVAARVLKQMDIEIGKVREQVLRELDPNVAKGSVQTITREDLKPPKEEIEEVDLTKRYDVYCREQSQAVVYRNVLFKGVRKLLPQTKNDPISEFLEIEQKNEERIFIAKSSVVKFCEHGVTPASEDVSG
jgi:ATP-dependent Clp protease ATP-binding subunit ClpA